MADLDEQAKRCRKDNDSRKPDTICARQYQNIASHTDHILDWAKEHFGEDKVPPGPV